MRQMLENHVTPTKELFDEVIQAFAEKKDAAKVDEWIIQAGHQNYTPAQAAFEAVVNLYSETQALKADEWLRRVQNIDPALNYKLPLACYDGVVRSLLRMKEAVKASSWLLHIMHENAAEPSDATLEEGILLFIETRDLSTAEACLGLLFERNAPSASGLGDSLLDAALGTEDLDTPDRQLSLTNNRDEIAQKIIVRLASSGDTARAREALDRFQSSGGQSTPEMGQALLAASAQSSDAASAEAAARLLGSLGTRLDRQAATQLKQAMGDQRAAALLAELKAAASPKAVASPAASPAAASAASTDVAASPAASPAPRRVRRNADVPVAKAAGPRARPKGGVTRRRPEKAAASAPADSS